MTDQQPANINLKLALEQSALQQSQQGVDKLDKQFAALKKDVQDTGKAADQTAATIGKAMGNVASTADAGTREIKKLKSALDAAGESAEKVGKKGINVEGLRRTGGALSSLGLGQVGGALSSAGDIGEVAKEAGALTSALGPLGYVLPVVTGAALGLQIGMKLLDDQLRDTKKSADEALAGLDAFYDALGKGTSKTIKQQIGELTELYNRKAQELNTLAAAVNPNLAMSGDLVHDAAVLLGKARGDFNQFTDKGQALAKELSDIKGKIDALNRALDDTKVASNDAAEALKAQQAAVMANLDLSVQARRQELADAKLNSTQQKQRLSDLQDERAILQSQMQVLQPLIATNEEAKKKYEALQTQMVLLNTEIANLTNTMIPASEAAEKMRQAVQKASDADIARFKEEQKVSEELSSMTYEQVQERLKAIEQEKATNDKVIEARILANQLLDKNSDEYKKNQAEIEAATKANEALNQELGRLKGGMDKLPAEISAANKRVADTTKKYNDDVKAIEQRSLEERANIQKKYNDKLVDVAREFADTAAATLRKLEQQREDLATTLGRDEQKAERESADQLLDIRIKAAREDAKASREHFLELERIKKDAESKEIGFLLDRNFLGLYQSRLQTTNDINKSNSQFANSQTDRQIQAQQEVQDLRTNIERQRRERLIAYQQQIADARLAYEREMADARRKRTEELQLAKETRDKDLADLRVKTAREQQTLKSSYDQELKIASLYGAARVKQEAATQAALLAQGQARLAAISGGSGAVKRRAGGGSLDTGDVSWVNDGRAGQRESFNGVPFPAGLGLFIPAQPGNVSQGSTAAPNVTIHINGAQDVNAIRREVISAIKTVMR